MSLDNQSYLKSRSSPSLHSYGSPREWVAFAALSVAVVSIGVATRLPSGAAIAVLVLSICVWTVAVFNHVLSVPHIAIVGVLAVTIFQDIAIGLFGGRDATRVGVLLVVVFTTALPAVLACWYAVINRYSLLSSRRFALLHVVMVAYVISVLINAASSGQSMSAMLPAMRNSFAFLIMFYFGLLVPDLTRLRFRKSLRGFSVLALIVIAFGYLERFILGDAFWIDVLNLDLIATYKNLVPTSVVPEPVPADFYSPIEGRYYRRMASLFATPISMGYFVAFALLYLVPFSHPLRRSSWSSLRIVAVLLLSITLVLTLVKGAYGIAALGAIAMFAAALGSRRGWSFGRILVGWTLAAVPTVVVGILLFPRSTALLHLNGLVFTFQGLSGTDLLLGRGVGTGGTISARLGANVAVSASTGAESGIGTLLFQTGLIGVCLFLMFAVLLLKSLYTLYTDRAAETDLRLGALGVLGGLFGLLGAVFLQENALAPIPIAPYYIFAGALLNARYRPGNGALSGAVAYRGPG